MRVYFTLLCLCLMTAGCKKQTEEVAYDQAPGSAPATDNQAVHNHPATSPHGESPHGASPHGASPHGASPHGASPHGASPHGSDPHASMSGGHPMAATGSVNPSNLKWTLPDGWTGTLAKQSMIRVADFNAPGGTVSCALYSLKNENLGQTINMWRNQIGLSVVSEEELLDFVKKQERFKTADDRQGIIIDLRPEQQSAEKVVVVSAIIPLENNDALFLKLTGKKSDLETVMDDYRSLAGSIAYKK